MEEDLQSEREWYLLGTLWWQKIRRNVVISVQISMLGLKDWETKNTANHGPLFTDQKSVYSTHPAVQEGCKLTAHPKY